MLRLRLVVDLIILYFILRLDLPFLLFFSLLSREGLAIELSSSSTLPLELTTIAYLASFVLLTSFITRVLLEFYLYILATEVVVSLSFLIF